jgi:uncharacterized membrane protein (DUF485 family)
MVSPAVPEAEAVRTFNRRLGLVLFAIYCLIYAGFIGLAVLSRSTLAMPAFFGVNLAVFYGVGLIGLAGVMAVLYLVLARTEPEEA